MAAGLAFVATCTGRVVGLVTLSGEVDMGALGARFNLGARIQAHHHDAAGHAEVDMFHVNPIFRHMTRGLLLQAMRLADKSVLFYALPAGQAPPADLLQELAAVPQRHDVPADTAAPADDAEGAFALFAFTRRLAMAPRVAVNARVLVVGASDTALALLEALLLARHLRFNHLTLLAPGGITLAGPAAAYDPAKLARMGLEAGVDILDAALVSLDRAARTVTLDDGAVLAYYTLALLTGAQDQTRAALVAANPAAADAIRARTLSANELAAGGGRVAALLEECLARGAPAAVCGDTLEAYGAVAALLAAGFPPSAVKFLAPPPPPGAPPSLAAVLRCVALDATPQEPLDIVGASPGEGGLLTLHCADAALVTRSDVSVGLLVTGAPPRVGAATFRCVNDACLIYDGALVVDANFATNDPS